MNSWTEHTANALRMKREIWPQMPEGLSYMSTPTMAPLPVGAGALAAEGCEYQLHPWDVEFPKDYMSDLNEMRALFAKLIKVSEDNVAVGAATAYYTALAAGHVRPLLERLGSSILLLEEQFHSNNLIWKKTAKATDAEVLVVKRSESSWTEGICAMLEERADAGKPVTVVALPNCHWTDGSKVDLEAVGALCQKHGSVLFVDATQSVGAIPIDVEKVKPHYMVASAYKWLFCPFGFAFCFIAPSQHHQSPLEEPQFNRPNGGMQPDGRFDVDHYMEHDDEYAAGAKKFDSGGRALPAVGKVCVRSLKLVNQWQDSRALLDHIEPLSAYLCSEAKKIGYCVPDDSQRMPHITGIRFPDSFPVGPNDLAELNKKLKKDKILVAIRGSSVRAALHLWNTKDDVDRLMQKLQAFLAN